jgi:hypothetical protein
LNQEDINHLSSCITKNEIEAVIVFQQRKAQANGLTTEFYETHKKELTPMLLKLFLRTENKGALTNSFYEASIIPTPKPDKFTTKQENYRLISLMNIGAKILKILANQIQQHIKRSYTMVKFVSFQECKNGSTYSDQ